VPHHAPHHRVHTALFCVTLFAACAGFARPQDSEPAPRFNARTITGEKFTNASIKGKIVLLDFWTTWCSFCATEAGLVVKLNHDYADKGLLVLAVNVGESKKKVNKYLAQHPRSSRVVLTDDTNLAAMYQATVYPIYVVIDRDGNIAATQRGAAGDEGLHRILARAGLPFPTASGSE
jgi:thiol-disulfide isomerase/thioredoxin